VEPEPELEPERDQRRRDRFELVSMEEAIARADEPLPTVIEGVAYKGFATVLVGKHSAGKSMAAMC
jgi:hypothetical protein